MIRLEEVLGRRYVVCEGTSGYSEFEVTMLEGKQVLGLITPEVYGFNGIRQYYFDVTDRVSFDELLNRRTVGEGELRNLFTCLNQTLACMRDYLIGADIILLDSKFIYFSEESVWFVYDLSERRDFGRELVLLVKGVLDKIDYDNRELVCRCYQIFDMVSCSPGGLQKIIDLFEESAVSISISDSGSVAGNETMIVSGEVKGIEEYSYIEPDEPEELIFQDKIKKHTDCWIAAMICFGVIFFVIVVEIVRNIMCVYC